MRKLAVVLALALLLAGCGGAREASVSFFQKKIGTQLAASDTLAGLDAATYTQWHTNDLIEAYSFVMESLGYTPTKDLPYEIESLPRSTFSQYDITIGENAFLTIGSNDKYNTWYSVVIEGNQDDMSVEAYHELLYYMLATIYLTGEDVEAVVHELEIFESTGILLPRYKSTEVDFDFMRRDSKFSFTAYVNTNMPLLSDQV